jgi:hypothetical protein
METTSLIDLVAGGLAVVVLIGGLLMLFNGISAFGDKDKYPSSVTLRRKKIVNKQNYPEA